MLLLPPPFPLVLKNCGPWISTGNQKIFLGYLKHKYRTTTFPVQCSFTYLYLKITVTQQNLAFLWVIILCTFPLYSFQAIYFPLSCKVTTFWGGKRQTSPSNGISPLLLDTRKFQDWQRSCRGSIRLCTEGIKQRTNTLKCSWVFLKWLLN